MNRMLVSMVAGCAIILSQAASAEEHCLVVQATAVAAYNSRMDLLLGTDGLFDAAFRKEEEASKAIDAKYRALIAAKNAEYRQNDPESQGALFGSPGERQAFFRHWTDDIKALDAAQSSEMAAYTEAFRREIAADPNEQTRRRIAEIDAKWNREAHLPCYWGGPR